MKILIVEDQPLMRQALNTLVKELDPAVAVLKAGDAEEAFSLAAQHSDIDLLMLDLRLPGQKDDFETLDALRRRHADIPVVVYSGVETRETAKRAIDKGAMGFIPKSTEISKTIDALRIVLKGMLYVPAELIHGSDRSLPPAPPPPGGDDPLGAYHLTPRDWDVLRLLVQGKPSKTIATTCGIGVQNVKTRVSTLLEKFYVDNRTELLFKLVRMGVLDRFLDDESSAGFAPGTATPKAVSDSKTRKPAPG